MSTKPLAFSLNSENLSSVLIELRSPFMFSKMFLMIVNNPENMFLNPFAASFNFVLVLKKFTTESDAFRIHPINDLRPEIIPGNIVESNLSIALVLNSFMKSLKRKDVRTK